MHALVERLSPYLSLSLSLSDSLTRSWENALPLLRKWFALRKLHKMLRIILLLLLLLLLILWLYLLFGICGVSVYGLLDGKIYYIKLYDFLVGGNFVFFL